MTKPGTPSRTKRTSIPTALPGGHFASALLLFTPRAGTPADSSHPPSMAMIVVAKILHRNQISPCTASVHPLAVPALTSQVEV